MQDGPRKWPAGHTSPKFCMLTCVPVHAQTYALMHIPGAEIFAHHQSGRGSHSLTDRANVSTQTGEMPAPRKKSRRPALGPLAFSCDTYPTANSILRNHPSATAKLAELTNRPVCVVQAGAKKGSSRQQEVFSCPEVAGW